MLVNYVTCSWLSQYMYMYRQNNKAILQATPPSLLTLQSSYVSFLVRMLLPGTLRGSTLCLFRLAWLLDTDHLEALFARPLLRVHLEVAFGWYLISVFLKAVLASAGPVPEVLRTVGTLVWLFSRVYPPVLLQVVFPLELFAALHAFVRPVRIMTSHLFGIHART